MIVHGAVKSKKLPSPSNNDDLSAIALDLDPAGIAGKGAAGGHGISGENIHTAAIIDAFCVRLEPDAGIQADNPCHDPIGDSGAAAQASAIIVDHDAVSV